LLASLEFIALNKTCFLDRSIIERSTSQQALARLAFKLLSF